MASTAKSKDPGPPVPGTSRCNAPDLAPQGLDAPIPIVAIHVTVGDFGCLGAPVEATVASGTGDYPADAPAGRVLHTVDAMAGVPRATDKQTKRVGAGFLFGRSV